MQKSLLIPNFTIDYFLVWFEDESGSQFFELLQALVM